MIDLDGYIRAADQLSNFDIRGVWLDILTERKFIGGQLSAAERMALEKFLTRDGIRICSYCGRATRLERCPGCSAHG